MNLRRAVAASALATVLVLAGCGAATPNDDVATPSASAAPPSAPVPSETPAETPSVVTALVLGDHDVHVFDADGVRTTAPLADVDAVHAALVEALGDVAPAPMDPAENGDVYQWDGVVLRAYAASDAVVFLQAASFGDIELRTSAGARVGMTQDEIAALPSVEAAPLVGPHGLPAYYMFAPEEVAGTDSLVLPGAVGRTFVQIAFDEAGETVTAIIARGDDFSDL